MLHFKPVRHKENILQHWVATSILKDCRFLDSIAELYAHCLIFYLSLIYLLILSDFLCRFGRVQSVKILSHNKDEDGEAATVAFMDIKSANKAHGVEHKIEDRLLKTDYYDPSSFVTASSGLDSNCDRATNSPRINPEDLGPGPGGGNSGSGSSDFVENNSRSSHNNSERRDFRGSSSGVGSASINSRGYEDSFSSRNSSSRSRSYRGGQSSFDR